MSSENMTSGFDLSYPLISRPESTQPSNKVVAKIEAAPREHMTGGFDLSWPLMSRRPEDLQQEQNDQSKKAA